MLSYHRFLSRDTIHVVSELHVDSFSGSLFITRINVTKA